MSSHKSLVGASILASLVTAGLKPDNCGKMLLVGLGVGW